MPRHLTCIICQTHRQAVRENTGAMISTNLRLQRNHNKLSSQDSSVIQSDTSHNFQRTLRSSGRLAREKDTRTRATTNWIRYNTSFHISLANRWVTVLMSLNNQNWKVTNASIGLRSQTSRTQHTVAYEDLDTNSASPQCLWGETNQDGNSLSDHVPETTSH